MCVFLLKRFVRKAGGRTQNWAKGVIQCLIYCMTMAWGAFASCSAMGHILRDMSMYGVVRCFTIHVVHRASHCMFVCIMSSIMRVVWAKLLVTCAIWYVREGVCDVTCDILGHALSHALHYWLRCMHRCLSHGEWRVGCSVTSWIVREGGIGREAWAKQLLHRREPGSRVPDEALPAQYPRHWAGADGRSLTAPAPPWSSTV